MTRSRDTLTMGFMTRGHVGSASHLGELNVKVKAKRTRIRVLKLHKKTRMLDVKFESRLRAAKVVDVALDVERDPSSVLSSGATFYQPDISYSHLAVAKSDEMWGGDPRDMSDEDLAFFGLER